MGGHDDLSGWGGGGSDAQPRNGVIWRIDDLNRRLSNIETLKPEVMAYEIRELRKDVTAMRRALYTFAFSAVGAAIVFAFTVFAVLGKGGP